MKDKIQKIASQNNLHLLQVYPLSGGDINQVYHLNCKEREVVLKLNDALQFPHMFSTEAKGLELLRSSETFKIPEVVATDTLEDTSYLLMEFIPTGKMNDRFWENFAEQLSRLHKTSRDTFGLDHNNYIGSLPQYNGACNSASEFYITQRLEPQIKMARNNGFDLGNLHSFKKNISLEIPDEAPSLVHGDLWSGNYMISHNGEPVLIDPAVAFSPREMDLAMMMLFGGFPREVFTYYNSFFPLEMDWENRIPIWQLYYVLVHLNLFGSGYLPQVKKILATYS